MSGDAIREDAFPCIGVEEQSLGYWSGRAEEYSALHMASYESGKREVFAREIALSLPDPGAGEEPPELLEP